MCERDRRAVPNSDNVEADACVGPLGLVGDKVKVTVGDVPRDATIGDELDELEETMPGIAAMATDVVGANGSHPLKAGPCAGCTGASDFLHLQNKLCACLSGSRLAKDRAADTVSKVMIPEALDYPA